MKKLFSLLLFLLIVSPLFGGATAREYLPLKSNWEWPIVVHDLYFFDLGQDGKGEIGCCFYNDADERGYIYILNESGHLILDTNVKGYTVSVGGQRREIPCADPNETATCYEWIGRTSQLPGAVEFIWLGDSDLDENLDILADCRGKGVGSSYLLYVFEREGELSLSVGNQRKWFFERAYFTTHALSSDFDSDGQPELLVSSMDSNIYVFDQEGEVKQKFQLNGSVWDFLLSDVDQDEEKEILVGYANGITLIKDFSTLWDFETEKRVFDVEIISLGENSSLVAGVTEDALYLLDSGGREKFRKSFLGIKGITTLDVTGDAREEILLLAESKIYALEAGNELTIKWEFPLSEAPRLIYSHFQQIFIPGKKLYNFVLNPDYLKNELAMRYLEEAKSYYPENCEKALEPARQAKELFWQINNPEKSIECDNIILHCSPSPEELEEIKLANEYFSLGKSYLDSGELAEAETYLKNALEIYLKWNYRRNAIQCDSLLLEIDEKLKTEGESKAKEYYKKAFDFFQQDELENASSYAGKALQIYLKINDSEGISNSKTLSLEIEKRESEKLSAYYFEKAKESYAKKDFENLSRYVELAKGYYLKMEPVPETQDKISICDSFLFLVQKYQQADGYYKRADHYFQNNDYENSILYAEEAREIFQEIGHQEGVKKCNELIKKIDQITGKAWERQLIYLLIGAVIISILIIVLIFWKKFR